MVTIRLSRTGANKRPFYHVVAKDKRSRRDSDHLERIGYFNPIASGAEVRLQLDLNRLDYWVGVGAQPSDRVSLLISEFKKHGARTGMQYKETRKPRKKKAAMSAEVTE